MFVGSYIITENVKLKQIGNRKWVLEIGNGDWKIETGYRFPSSIFYYHYLFSNNQFPLPDCLPVHWPFDYLDIWLDI